MAVYLRIYLGANIAIGQVLRQRPSGATDLGACCLVTPLPPLRRPHYSSSCSKLPLANSTEARLAAGDRESSIIYRRATALCFFFLPLWPLLVLFPLIVLTSPGIQALSCLPRPWTLCFQPSLSRQRTHMLIRAAGRPRRHSRLRDNLGALSVKTPS